MRNQAILVAAITLLLGAEAGLIKPAPGTAAELVKPETGPDNELIRPDPGTDIGLTKPLPGTGEELIKPAPGTGGSLTKPAPGTGGSLTKPAPGTGGELTKPAPGTGEDLSKPAPGTDPELIKPAPGAGEDLSKPAPGSGGSLTKPAPGSGGSLTKPAPGTGGSLTKPAPGTGEDLSKPAPGTDPELIKPAPGTGEDLSKPAPGSGGSLTKPAPGTGGSLTKPAPGTGGSLTKPAPGTGEDLSKPAPGTDPELIKPAPGTGEDLSKPAPGAGGSLTKPAPGTGGSLTKPAPGTGGSLTKPAPGEDGELIKPLPGTGGELIKPLPGTGGELIKPPPGAGGSLTKPSPGTGGSLTKPAPGTGGSLTKPAPGTGGSLTKPAPGTGPNPELIQPQPIPETRKVLPHLVLSPELANALQIAQTSVSSRLLTEAKINRMIPVPEDTVLEDIFFQIDEDISVQLSNLQLVNVPVIDVISAKPNLEFLNMGLDVELGALQVEGSFEITSKNILAEIPITSSGEIILKNSDVKATGKVGLTLVEDSLKSINHDIHYESSGTFLTVSYQNDNGRVVSGLEIGNQEAKVAEHINRQLKNVLNRLVAKRLDEVLSAISVEELISETRAVQSYREHVKALRVVANDYVDEVLLYVKSFVQENQLSQIAIPDVRASFSKEILWVTWHGEFGTSQGHAASLSTLIRTQDISLDFDENSGAITVFGSLGLTELDIGYNNYVAQFMGIGPSGTVAASVGQNSIFVKVGLILAQQPIISLEDFHIEYANNINIEITGLGVLDWLTSKIATWVVGLFNDQIVGSLDTTLHQYLVEILPNVNPNQYFG